MEYEFIDFDKAREELNWLCNFIEDIPIWPK